MARHTEPITGPVVSSKDPGLLKPGELSSAQNALWLRGAPGLNRYRGRVAFGTVSATAVDVAGLRSARFDNQDNLLVAHASASYLTAVVGDSGTFGVLASGLPAIGTSLEVVQYRNRYFLMNGTSASATGLTIGSNRVLYLSATAAGTPASLRQHGMLAVQAGPVSATAAGTFSQSVTGYYEYWTTELAKIQQDGVTAALESTFVGSPTTVFVSSTGQVPVISMPATLNAITTQWRIYRSPVKTSATDTKFPTGFMIAELAATGASAQVTAQDTSTTSDTGYILPGNVNGVGDGATQFAGWGAAAKLSADDGVYASATPITGGLITNVVQQGVYGFNFGGFVGSVGGIEIQIKGFSNGTPYPVDVTIGRSRKTGGGWSNLGSSWGQQVSDLSNNTVTRTVTITATAAGSPQTISLGGASDRWFPSNAPFPFNSSDFDTNFMAVLTVSKAASISLDFVKARVYHDSTVVSTVQFPTVVYTFGDITSQVGKRGTPPSSSTGDIFEGSLVCNDVDFPRLLKYSFPDEPESFPSTYFVPFETSENDAITLVKNVNNRMVVGLKTSIWRVNYLPNERDAQFDRGKAKEPISRNYGVVNPMCACVYSPDGESDYLAFVSQQGIHQTNGYDFTTMTDDLDWRGTILSLTSTSTPIALINDRERFQLLFFFRNDSYGQESIKCLPLCYHGEHLSQGTPTQTSYFGRRIPKAGGLVNVRNYDAGGGGSAGVKSAWAVNRTNGDASIYLGYGDASAAAGAGKVYIESGTTIPSQDASMKYATRRMYLAGESNEWELNEVYGYSGNYTGSPVVTYTVNGSKTNDTGPTQGPSKAITLGGQKLHKVLYRNIGEGIQVSASISASAFSADYLVLNGESFGVEDAGR